MNERTAEITLQVTGMSCLSCVAHVEGALGDLEGVERADADLRRGTVRIGYAPGRVSTADMVQALGVLGYPSREAAG